MTVPLSVRYQIPSRKAHIYHQPREYSILKDPVCGMTVTDKSFYHLVHQGQTHYFCDARCKLRFASYGLRHAGAGPAKGALSSDVASQRGLKWRTGWILSLALLATLLFCGSWLLGL
jgi:YHS domain-containing protein